MAFFKDEKKKVDLSFYKFEEVNKEEIKIKINGIKQ